MAPMQEGFGTRAVKRLGMAGGNPIFPVRFARPLSLWILQVQRWKKARLI